MHPSTTRYFFATLCSVALAACGSSSDEGPGGPGPAGQPDPEDPIVEPVDNEPSASGLPTYDGELDGEDRIVLDVPEQGFQLRTGINPVAGGGDQEWCEVLEVPGEPGTAVYVEHVQIALANNSHHGNVMAVLPGSDSDAATVVGDRVDCLANGQQPYGGGLYNIAGGAGLFSENTFPDGVGIRLEGGQKIVMNMHYVNASGDEVPGQAAINFFTADPGVTLTEMRRFGWYDMAITLPPLASSSSVMECRMSEDVYLHGLFRHTHKMGTDFNIWHAGGANDGEHLWVGHEWNENLGLEFEEPMLVRAGEGFRFQCDFVNTEDRAIAWGDTGSDEMCILYGRYYATTPGGTVANQACVALAATQPDAEGVLQGFPCPTCP